MEHVPRVFKDVTCVKQSISWPGDGAHGGHTSTSPFVDICDVKGGIEDFHEVSVNLGIISEFHLRSNFIANIHLKM